MYGLSVEFPLRKSQEDGFYALNKTYSDLVVQNFKNLMLTEPGERIMDPEFGVGVRSLLFEQDTEFVRGTIASRAEDQVQKYMPALEIINIDFSSGKGDFGNPEGHVFYMEVVINVKPLGKNIRIPFRVRNLT